MSTPTPREAADGLEFLTDDHRSILSPLAQRHMRVLLDHARATDPATCPCCGGDPLTVCAACDQHACWAGRLMCDESRTAGTYQATPPSAPAAGGDLAALRDWIMAERPAYPQFVVAEVLEEIDRRLAAAPASEAATEGEGEITTVEQLDELAAGTALRDNDGRLYERTRDDCGTWTGAYSRVGRDWPDVPTLPARLLSTVATTPREQGTAEAATEGGDPREGLRPDQVRFSIEAFADSITILTSGVGDREHVARDLRWAADCVDPVAIPQAEGEAAAEEASDENGYVLTLPEAVSSLFAAQRGVRTQESPGVVRGRIGAAIAAIQEHVCAPPAPEVVSGAEAAPRVHVVDADRTDEREYLRVIAPVGTTRAWAEADLVVDRTGRVLKWRGRVTPAPTANRATTSPVRLDGGHAIRDRLAGDEGLTVGSESSDDAAHWSPTDEPDPDGQRSTMPHPEALEATVAHMADVIARNVSIDPAHYAASCRDAAWALITDATFGPNTPEPTS